MNCLEHSICISLLSTLKSWHKNSFLRSMDKQILTKVGYIKILIGLCGILLRSLKIALWTIPPNTSMMVAVMVMIEANNLFVWLSNIFKSSESQNRSKSCWVWLSVIVKFSVITMIPKCPKITHLAWADFEIKIKWIAHSTLRFDQWNPLISKM